jgi:hypothetical protein
MKGLLILAVIGLLGWWLYKKMAPPASPLDDHINEKKQLSALGAQATRQGNRFRPLLHSKFTGPFTSEIITPFSRRKPVHGIPVYPPVTDQNHRARHAQRARIVQGGVD